MGWISASVFVLPTFLKFKGNSLMSLEWKKWSNESSWHTKNTGKLYGGDVLVPAGTNFWMRLFVGLKRRRSKHEPLAEKNLSRPWYANSHTRDIICIVGGAWVWIDTHTHWEAAQLIYQIYSKKLAHQGCFCVKKNRVLGVLCGNVTHLVWGGTFVMGET